MSLEADREGAATLLRDRLALLRGRAASAPVARPAPAPARHVELPGGHEEATPFGPCYVVERRYPLDHRHGPRPLGALRDVPPALLADLGGVPQLAETPLDRVLWLDTETTGLAGGTGTYVFLVGLGFFTGPADGAPAFAVRQYFLREPREERALMHALGAALDDFGVLVTFNGKSFDWPLLATRFVLQRLPHGRRAWPHLDLLHPARRVWKHRLPSCSLGSLEERVLGVRREVDVPGFLIPQIYFQYLRDGDPRPLLPVLAHNEADIVSLLALLIHLGHLAARPAEAAPPGADCYGLATLYAALGRAEESIAAYRAALADPALSPPLRRAARGALALALKRAARWEEAGALWRESIKAEARRRAPDPWAHEELAKYQEHVARDYAAALATVDAALTLLALRGVATGRDALLHRQARLRRKLTMANDE
ncbi:MAG TPA: ribonuclease H-like domain-containing protein [Thermomicrobiales bacterium]|nr:ribonuclease H-like domain-containing protein [Thermomicrobiales bacterium]